MSYVEPKDFELTDKEKEELDVFFPKIGKYYQAICLYNGVIADLCPNNENSLCTTKFASKPRDLYHKWDGKNVWKCLCG